jgi:hypothetical protein
MYPMLDTLPSLSHAHLPKFLIILTPLTTSHPQLFAPHIHALLSFLPALIIPSADSGPTPTVARPFPGTQSFTFPPTPNGGHVDDEELDEEAEEVRKAALEFMISLSEAKPAMVRRTDGWVSAIVRGCLGGMGELRDDELASWLDADVRVSFSQIQRFTYQSFLAGGRPHGRHIPACVRTSSRPSRLRSRRQGGPSCRVSAYSWDAGIA